MLALPVASIERDFGTPETEPLLAAVESCVEVDLKDAEVNDAEVDGSEVALSIGPSLDESISSKINDLLPELVRKVKDELSTSSVAPEPAAPAAPAAPAIPVHRHIICDGCGMAPITGIRYKCAVCPDMDLCEKCETSFEHPHPFLKIRHPKQAPHKIFAVLREDDDAIHGGLEFAADLFQGKQRQGHCPWGRGGQQVSNFLGMLTKNLIPQPPTAPVPAPAAKPVPAEKPAPATTVPKV